MPEVISVVQPAAAAAAPAAHGWFFGMSTWFFIVCVLMFVFALLILAGLALLAYFVYKYIKFMDDAFYQIRRAKKKMCKIHGDTFRMPQAWWHFFKADGNQPIVCQWKEGDQIRTKTVGYYQGHYSSQKCTFIAFKDKIHKWLYFFPETNILILNKNEKVSITIKDETNNKSEEMTIAYPKVVETFSDNMIIINACGIDDAGYFFVPVVKDIAGNMIDLTLPAYAAVRDVAIHKYLYEQTCDYLKVNGKHMGFNPLVKFAKETSDTTGKLETTQP